MREMSVLEDYEIVDAALRDRLAVLKADIDSMTGGGGEPVILPYIINPHNGYYSEWNTVYLNGKGEGQSGYTDIGNWNYDAFFKPTIYGTSINGELVDSIPRLGGWCYYGDYAGMVFNDPIDCRGYKYLKIKYYISSHDGNAYNRAYVNLAKDTTIGEDSQTANNYKTVELCPEFGFVADSSKGSPLYNAEHEYWKWVTIDISDIDEFYFSVSFNARDFYIIEALLSNDGPEQLPPIVRTCEQMLYEHFGFKSTGASWTCDESNEYCGVYISWLDYTRVNELNYPIRPLTIAFLKENIVAAGWEAEYVQSEFGLTGLNNCYTYFVLKNAVYVSINNVDLRTIIDDPVAVTKYIIDNVSPSSLTAADYVALPDSGRFSSMADYPIYMYHDEYSKRGGDYCTEYQLEKIQYLPDEPLSHTQVTSITTDGECYIDTGICPSPYHVTEAKIRTYITKDHANNLFGCYDGVAKYAVYFSAAGSNISSGGSGAIYAFRSPSYDQEPPSDLGTHSGSLKPVEAATKVRVYKLENYILSVDGEATVLLGNPIDKTPFNQSIYLFAINDNGTVSNYKGKMQCQYVKIWDQDNILVRDMVPVIKSDGTICMYDKVTEEYFYNLGSGTFGYVE